MTGKIKSTWEVPWVQTAGHCSTLCIFQMASLREIQHKTQLFSSAAVNKVLILNIRNTVLYSTYARKFYLLKDCFSNCILLNSGVHKR
jgi:hypothetical protein